MVVAAFWTALGLFVRYWAVDHSYHHGENHDVSFELVATFFY